MKLSSIKSNPNNPRLIKDDKFKKLVNSIKEFPKMMELRPMVLNEEGVVLGGNMRLKALKELGYKEIPNEWVKSASELSDEEQRRFIIADNVGFGEHDWDMLVNEWDTEELSDSGLDIALDYENSEDITIEDDDFDEDVDDIETNIKYGDIIEIGRHRLMCGNSFKDISSIMKGEKSKMVFTDPPYDLKEELYNNTIENNTDNAHIFVMHDDKGIVEYLRKSKLDFKRVFVADFKFSSLRGNDFYLKHILVSHETKGKAIPHKNMHDGLSSIIKMDYRGNLKDDETTHKHQKSIDFISKFITHYSNENDLVLDIFAGSGSTMLTCEQTNRINYSVELDPKFCQLIINRMINYNDSLKVKINGEDYGV